MVKIVSESNGRPWTDRAILRRLYVKDDLTLEDMAARFGCCEATVYKWLDRYGIVKPWRNEQVLRDLYERQGKTMEEVADALDCSVKAVRTWFRRHEIEVRPPSGRPRTENPKNTYYGSGWTEQRKKALERDGYECVRCGLAGDEHADLFGGVGLHIHHSTPFSSFEDPEKANRVENLKTLCVACHNAEEHGGTGNG